MDEIIEENVAKQTAYLLGEQSGLKQGIERGSLEKQNEMVINMSKDNVNLELIAKYSNLTIEEVKKIIKENDN